MTSSIRISASVAATFAIALLCLLAATTSLPAQAQTLTVLHNFNNFPDGKSPEAGVTMDGAGNLYGTTSAGGDPTCNNGFGCGSVFELKQSAHGWLLNVLEVFSGPNGLVPLDRVVFGPDGALYGTTEYGGAFGFGVVFRLTPPPTFCRSVSCPWRETVLHSFQGADGSEPSAEVLFYPDGNLYGTTQYGGTSPCGTLGCGVVYKMTRSGAGWTYGVIYDLTGGQTGEEPDAGLTLDQAGNLYGTTLGGGRGQGFGTVFELMPAGNTWQETVLHSFDGNDGLGSFAGLIFDQAGNLYGATSSTVFELTPVSGGWTFSTLYTFSDSQPLATLSMDGAGNLYGTARSIIGGECGEVFELSPQGGSWTHTTIHAFQGSDGCEPASTVLIDGQGNLFGTTTSGGTQDAGVSWEITR
jgi:uncharacterized repeat protein (TIGR03803 family)